MKTNRACFTLIELLVVISIISILAALLMPALKRSVDSAYTTKCANNLHKIKLATKMYADDFDGYFPAARGPNGEIANFLVAIATYGGVTSKHPGNSKDLYLKHGVEGTIFDCPVSQGPYTTPHVHFYYDNYGVNYKAPQGIPGYSDFVARFGFTGWDASAKIPVAHERIRQPQHTTYLMDIDTHGGAETMSGWSPRHHGDSAGNVLFYDGQVRLVPALVYTADFSNNFCYNDSWKTRKWTW